MRDAILAKLQQVEAMLATATCDGELLSDEIAEHVYATLSTLTQTVEYYID